MHSCCRSHFPFCTEKLVSDVDMITLSPSYGQSDEALSFLDYHIFILCLVAFCNKDYRRIYIHGLPLYIIMLTPSKTAPMKILRLDPFIRCTMQPHILCTGCIASGCRIRFWNLRGSFHFVCLAWMYDCILGEMDGCHTKIFQWFNI